MDIAKAKCPNCERDMAVTSMVCGACDIKIEATFELSPLSRLSPNDQEFIVAFVGSHGSIKEMERQFNVSYPTVKNRLSAIARALDARGSDVNENQGDPPPPIPPTPPAPPKYKPKRIDDRHRTEILRQVEDGSLPVQDALRLLKT